jgi:hypothetical protein
MTPNTKLKRGDLYASLEQHFQAEVACYLDQFSQQFRDKGEVPLEIIGYDFAMLMTGG